MEDRKEEEVRRQLNGKEENALLLNSLIDAEHTGFALPCKTAPKFRFQTSNDIKDAFSVF